MERSKDNEEWEYNNYGIWRGWIGHKVAESHFHSVTLILGRHMQK